MTFEPLARVRPAHKWTNGDLAAKVGADLGITPDPEQQWILDAIYGETAANRPASGSVFQNDVAGKACTRATTPAEGDAG